MLQHLPCLNNIARFRSWQIVLWGCVDVNIASIRGEGWKELFASLLGTVILLLKKKKKRGRKAFFQTAGAQNKPDRSRNSFYGHTSF